jgi:hypothetical protein
MNFLETFVFDMFQGISFIPPIRENIKGYLTSDRVREAVIWKLLLQSLYESSPIPIFLKKQ